MKVPKIKQPYLHRRRLAAYCGFYPDPTTWPVKFLDRLFWIEKRQGSVALAREVRAYFEHK